MARSASLKPDPRHSTPYQIGFHPDEIGKGALNCSSYLWSVLLIIGSFLCVLDGHVLGYSIMSWWWITLPLWITSALYALSTCLALATAFVLSLYLTK